MDMRTVYVVDDRWCAGIQTLRQPVELPDRFGPRPSLSLFLYNQNGLQAIARPYLDGPPLVGEPADETPRTYPEMPKYREFSRFDDATNAPSSNFIYAFEHLRFLVRDDWREVLHHDAQGNVVSGSTAELADACRRGAEVKVALAGLCDDLAVDGAPLPHEAIVSAGPTYYYTQERVMVAGTHPFCRVRPAVPLAYGARGWDYAWGVVRTDGQAALLIYDPYTLQPRRASLRLAMRWFLR